jgi:CheY-like chemotaxis protein
MNTPHKQRTVLVLDDDEINLMILVKNAQESGFSVKSFSSSEAAWNYMNQHPAEIDIAILDKMMPTISGLEMLRRIKSSEALMHMPVILQTGDAGVTQMREGLESGAYYYLTKPFHPEILTAILHSAAGECTTREELLKHMGQDHARFIGLLQEGEFLVKDHNDARLLAATLSQAASYPEFVALGLSELLTNAIEHGNLGIGCERKRKCMLAGTWDHEIASRMGSAEYSSRAVHVRADRIHAGLRLTIRDEGKGFDWQHYVHDDGAPNSLNEPNGRGIAKALIMLDDVRYMGKGNEVHCIVTQPTCHSSVGQGRGTTALHN